MIIGFFPHVNLIDVGYIGELLCAWIGDNFPFSYNSNSTTCCFVFHMIICEDGPLHNFAYFLYLANAFSSAGKLLFTSSRTVRI